MRFKDIRLRLLFVGGPFLVGVICFALSLFGFLPYVWLCDIASQLRIVLEVLLACSLIVLTMLRSRICASIVAVGLIVNSVPIVDLYFPLPNHTEPSRTISILNVNTEFQHNERYDLLQKLIEERDPDLFAVVEANKKWIDAMESMTKRFKFQKVVLVGPGMALFSKYPVEHVDVRFFGKSHHPRIFATLLVDERKLQVVIAHPTTPKSEGGYAERTKEFSLLHDELAALPSPKILIGDLNCGPWSADFRKLLGAGLQDSERGFGPQPSWPARSGRVFNEVPIPPLVPIDHVLVSGEFRVVQRQTDMSIGSDHLPVFVKLGLE